MAAEALTVISGAMLVLVLALVGWNARRRGRARTGGDGHRHSPKSP